MSRPAPSAPPEIPGFTYVREIGQGGFADVYLYSQLTPRREVAVKVLHADMAGSEAATRLNREADAMASLSQHQNIVTVFQSGAATDGRPYLVMEYYSRPALSKGLRQTQRSLASVLRIGIQLAGALESAHRVRVPGADASGILHRDIKPANILVDRSGRPVLGDFGIAMSNAEAQEGGAQGMSIPWSPPEAFDKSPRPSPQSDIWSLAATLYALLTGRSPFEDPGGNNQTHAMIDRICHAPYRPLGRIDAPASLDQVLSTAMAKSPQARYTSMKAFGTALRAVEAELGLPATQMDILDDLEDLTTDRTDDDIGGTSLRPITIIDPTGTSGTGGTGATGGRVGSTGSAGTGWGTDRSLGSVTGSSLTGPATLTSDPSLASVEPLEATRFKAPPTRGSAGPDTHDQTLLKALQPLGAPAAEAPPERQSPTPEPGRKPGKLIALVVAIVVIVVVIVVAVLLGKSDTGLGTGPSGPPGSASPQNPVGPALPKAPTDTKGEVDKAKGVVVFTWTNPDPKTGDKYLVRVIGSAEPGPQTVSLPQVTVEVPGGAHQVCIGVRVIRAGVPSDEAQWCEAVA